jgi:hypothetical protein
VVPIPITLGFAVIFFFIVGLQDPVTESSIIDLVGRSSDVKLDQQSEIITLDIRGLAAGMYILKLTSGPSVAEIKFIK